MAPKRKSSGEAAPTAGQKTLASFFGAAARPKAGKENAGNGPKSPVRPSKRPPATPPTRQSPRVKQARTEAGGAEPVTAPGSVANAENGVQNGTASQAKTKRAPATPATAGKRAAAPGSGRKQSPLATPEMQGGMASAPPDKLVGRRIKVWWQDDDAWYAGGVASYDARSGRHTVDYDDGEEEELNLAQEKYEIVPGKAVARAAALRPGRRARTLLSDSDEEEEEAAGADSGSDSASEFVANGADEGSSSSDEELELSDDSEGGDTGTPPPRSTKRTPAKRKGKQQLTGKPAKKGRSSSASSTPARRPVKVSPAAEKPGEPRTPAAPQAGAKAVLASAGRAPSTAPRSSSGTGDAAPQVQPDMERFAARDAERFPFLAAGKLRDAAGMRPGQPGYNPRTLWLPPNWFKAQKISPGQQQWWEFKIKHFDSVLLFKMGRFYEMFEMDAHVGVEVLGLTMMKGEQPHCGFPENSYHMNCEQLARAGLRVVVVEQTETPVQLAARNEERRKQKLPKASVVNREMVAVVTKGTMTDAEMLSRHPDASFLLALAEAPASAAEPATGSEGIRGDAQTVLGACAVDVATGQMLIGQWTDGELRTGLRSHLASLQPVEVILPEGASGDTRRALQGACEAAPRLNELAPRDAWDAARTRQELAKADYWPGDAPPVLQTLLEDDSGGSNTALAALGAAMGFLRCGLLDAAVMPLARPEALPPAGSSAATAGSEQPQHMRLDGAALQNLEVFENDSGGTHGTLFAACNQCVTGPGRRLLRRWLGRPLARCADIARRQDAVAALLGPAADAAREARSQLKGIADMERGVARLVAAAGGASVRDGQGVVLYEDAARRRVNELAGALAALRTLADVAACFAVVAAESDSGLLSELVTPGRGFPDMDAALAELEGATDWAEARSAGRVVPREGVDELFDAAEAAVRQAEADLQRHLKDVRRRIGGGSNICFVSVNKDSHLIEVPEGLKKAVPGDFELVGQKKGFQRFSNPELKELVVALEEAQQQRETRLTAALQVLLQRFSERRATWLTAVEAAAQLDALMSLAMAAASGDGDMCRPELVEVAPGGQQVFEAKGLRHPCAYMSRAASCFVPNDVRLGGGEPPFILLTGPNMGGKSTLLRQACLAALLAQVGAWVPASSFQLSPADAIFVRMGARDHILSGESTFFVELSETASMLQAATQRSIVALDELGRGTATTDGAAIAAAVLEHLSTSVRCRGLFATHYHRLSDEHAVDPGVAVCHMACAVTPAGPDGQPETVTFLYKLVEGACPKSYGMNVARLAGIPESVISRAATIAHQAEAADAARQQSAAVEDSSAAGDGGWSNVSDITQAAAVRQIQQLLASDDQEAAEAALVQLQARLKRLLATKEQSQG